ncbi:MAG TPA: LysM peptidoglycan-binding domain-containing protein [Nocardioides sp.]|nr:LysM peptidoglycan-binding domain-containing protein [Nocardioides sp.]
MNDATAAVRRRAALLWLVVTAGTAGLVLTAGPTAGLLRSGASFADLVVGACGLATVTAAVLLWTLTTDVAWRQLRSPGTVRAGRRTGPVRALLLAACGVAAVAGPAAATGDGPAPALDGLPLPDRATGATTHAAPADRPDRPSTVRVRPGDSLWAIAARTLGPDATPADLTSYWHRIHALNASAVGADPDLLHPGQQLRLPPPAP